MPSIFGVKLLPAIAAAIAFFFVGFVWYGLLFAEAWMAAEGVTAEEAEADSPLWMIGGFAITIMQTIGLGLAMKWRNVTTLGGAIGTALILWLVFALPFTLYDYFYTPEHDQTLLAIDASHLLIGWGVAAAVLALLKYRA
jgi:hypothetical protein